MEKINILYLENSTGYGGSSSNLYHILRNLDRSKYNPFVLIHNDGPNFAKIKQLGIKIIKVPFENANTLYTCGRLTFLLLFFGRNRADSASGNPVDIRTVRFRADTAAIGLAF